MGQLGIPGNLHTTLHHSASPRFELSQVAMGQPRNIFEMLPALLTIIRFFAMGQPRTSREPPTNFHHHHAVPGSETAAVET